MQCEFVSIQNTKKVITTTLKQAPSLKKEQESVGTIPMHSGQCARFVIFHVNTTQVMQMGSMVGTELRSVENGIG